MLALGFTVSSFIVSNPNLVIPTGAGSLAIAGDLMERMDLESDVLWPQPVFLLLLPANSDTIRKVDLAI